MKETGVIYMNKSQIYAKLNQTKMDFSDLYTSTDPRKYFQYLGQLDYIIPHLAQPVFDQLIRARRALQGRPVTVLDLGCSYAINGALMKYTLDYEALRQRYTAPALQGLSSAELNELDRHFYRAWPKQHPALRVIGLDISENAVRYAEACGILDQGLSVDLESRDLNAKEAELLAGVDLIISTGCVGYVTAKTFQRLATTFHKGRTPWVASFVLRMFPFDDIAATLSEHGLVTEPYEGATFVQRRFANREEMEATIRAVEARGLDSYGREAEGLFHANLFVSRPVEEIERLPIQKLVTVVSGVNKLWNVGANVLGSFGPAARRRARAERREHFTQMQAASS
jgi:SAM-dependent methyltransferase